MKYFAHTARHREDWEPLKTHLLNVAVRARQFASAFGAGVEGYIAGLLHDLGKYGIRFQERLHGKGRHIDHWTAGAWAAIKQYGKTGRCLALVTQGHHVGLQQDHKSCLDKICNRTPFPDTTLSADSMSELLQLFAEDGLSWPTLQKSFYSRTGKRCSDMLDVRMLFSALVDADYLETEKFINTVEVKPQRMDAPLLQAPQAFDALIRRIAKLNAEHGSLRSDVAVMRATLLESCLAAAKTSQKAFTLSAPTGSGKTLSMLAFALQHAIENPDISHIIVVLPFLNIVEQTALVYREVFKDFPNGYVIEHHSLAGTRLTEDGDNDADQESAAYRERLAAENWDTPVIITTSVQFFESIFANRPSACRKLHNVARSIVLFDEAQTLPPELAIHTLAALSRLVERYQTTVVFATATQPAFSALHQETLKWCAQGWSPSSVLTRETETQLFGNARRVRFEWGAKNDRLSWEAVADKMLERRHKQALCVVNTKKQARELTACLCSKMSSEERDSVFHFSTDMCPQHRRDRLAEIKARLDAHQPCYLVATQCIEAGVDISFPVVFRAWAPLEAIIQTAGRCNRNNELFPEKGICYVFTPIEEKFPIGFYGDVATIARSYVESLDEDAKVYLDAPSVIETYYITVYEFLKQPTSAKKFKDLCEALEGSDFTTVAEKYRLIEQDMVNLVVPYGEEGRQLMEAVLENGLNTDWSRKAQLYSVAVRRPRQGDPIRDIMEPAPIFKRGERLESEDWFLCTANAKYDELTGLEVPRGNDFCDCFEV
jgi:CRISPR-associated helicase Cas3/CRISPR-associated endonuclease Cas3-HD